MKNGEGEGEGEREKGERQSERERERGERDIQNDRDIYMTTEKYSYCFSAVPVGLHYTIHMTPLS